MSTVNQCFFTDKALYVVVWNLAMGEEAVACLQTWLLNIEVQRHSSAYTPESLRGRWICSDDHYCFGFFPVGSCSELGCGCRGNTLGFD